MGLATLIALVYFVSFLELWIAATFAITVIHTIEESTGEIWQVLGVPAVSYFAFQGLVLTLGIVVYVCPELAWLFIAVRFFDAIVTHLIVQAPGRWTAGLLILDGVVLLMLLSR